MANQWRDEPDETTLARALRLPPVDRPERHGGDVGNIVQLITTRVSGAVEPDGQFLDRLIGDIGSPAEATSFRCLAGQTALLVPRLEGMVAAIERAVLVGPNRGRANAQQMFRLVQGLPADAVAPLHDRLEALWVKDGWFEFHTWRATKNATMPERCKTIEQQAMSEVEPWRDLDTRRNRVVNDDDLIAAYRDPACHPADVAGDIVLGVNRDATVMMGYRNGHLRMFYTPGSRLIFDPSRNTFSIEHNQQQDCASIGGVRIQFGPDILCALPPVAPLMLAAAPSVARLATGN